MHECMMHYTVCAQMAFKGQQTCAPQVQQLTLDQKASCTRSHIGLAMVMAVAMVTAIAIMPMAVCISETHGTCCHISLTATQVCDY